MEVFFEIKSVMSLNGHHLWKSLLDFTDVERDAKGRKQTGWKTREVYSFGAS